MPLSPPEGERTDRTMTNALSLYLDALRFGAAFVVFLSHYAKFTRGMFWQTQPYGRTAVMVFFVLSGFVIAWVTQTRERTLEEYALSRVARLYSVILPAFLLTVVLDHIAMAIDPRLYGPEYIPVMNRGPLDVFLGYLLSGLFLGVSWTLMMFPGSDIAYWSVNCEAWYYILFAAATFLRGRPRIVALAVAALVAGPPILGLFPLWLMGLLAWRWHAAVPRRWGAPLVFGTLAAFVGLEALGGQSLFQQANSPWLPGGLSAYDFIVGAFVALFIAGLANAPLPMPGAAVQRLVRFLAGTTFGLYLLHLPLLNFFATVIPGPPDRATFRILVFVVTLGVAIAISHVIEQQKGPLKRALRSGLDLVRRKRLQPALERQGLP
jgi:peptidoglycan/LPS O-acetylase OafA/YrhL